MMPVPLAAQAILDFIASFEAPEGYDTIYGNNQGKLTKRITTMTLDELLKNQSGFTKAFGSSAAGRYQFMRNTLLGLKKEMGLLGTETFDPSFQDRLGFQLLKRRGYDKWAADSISDNEFMLGIAKEWASFPVPTNCPGAHRLVARGETYYAGDKLNRCLVTPEKVEAAIAQARVFLSATRALQPTPRPIPVIAVGQPVTQAPVPARTAWQRFTDALRGK